MTELHINRHGDVVEILLASPELKNVLNDELSKHVSETLTYFAADDTTKAVILGSTGEIFTAGGDLSMLSQMSAAAQDETQHQALQAQLRQNMHVVEQLWNFPKPVIAAVSGPCIGAGIGWIAACDLSIATHDAFFDTAYLNLGVGTDFGVAWLLAQSVGSARALDWILRPRQILAEEARTAGLIGSVVSEGQLLTSAYDAASFLSRVEPEVIQGVRQGVADAHRLPLAEALDAEATRFVAHLRNARLPSRAS